MEWPNFTLIPWEMAFLEIDYSARSGSTPTFSTGRATPAANGATTGIRIPLVQNLLRNRDYRQYYLDYLEHLIDTEFNPGTISAVIGAAPTTACGHVSARRPTSNQGRLTASRSQAASSPTTRST